MSNVNEFTRAAVHGRIQAMDNGPAGLKSWERDKVHRSVTLQSYVYQFAGKMAVFAGLAGAAGAAMLLMLLAPATVTGGYAVAVAALAGLLAAGLAGVWALQQRGAAFDDLAHEYEFIDLAEQPAPARAPEPLVMVNGEPMKKQRRAKRVEHDGHEFTFTGRNLDRLLAWYEAGEQVIRRDQAANMPGFNALPDPIKSSDYTTALFVLKGRGLVDDRNQWTDLGVAFLRGE